MGFSYVEGGLMEKKIAFLFPGQGAQYSGMGKDFAEAFPEAKQVFEEADDLLQKNVSRLIFSGLEQELKKTANSQLGIFITSVALLKVVEKLFPELKAAGCGGLSLGEYTALFATGRASFSDTLFLVKRRGELMAEACEQNAGAMAVVMGLSLPEIQDVISSLNIPNDLWIANCNCPGQVVLSGTLQGITKGTEATLQKGARKVVPLEVQGAFHSGLMLPAQSGLTPYLEEISLQTSSQLFPMNVVGDFVSDESAIRKNLILQVTRPVLWEKGIHALEKATFTHYLEIGPGKTLTGMNKRIGVVGNCGNVGKLEDLDKVEKQFYE